MGTTGQNENGRPACLTLDACRSSVLMDRPAIGERVWDVMRLIDIIYAYLDEYIDTDRLLCMGNSGGGTTTFYASCMDQRIRFSMPSCAVCSYDASIIALRHCACNYIPGIRKYFEMGDLGGLIAPRPLVVVCGKDDDIFPLHGVETSYALIRKVYERFSCADSCRLVIGGAGHRFYPDEAWPVMMDMLDSTPGD